MLVLSESSIDSKWVDFELKKALQKEVDEKRVVLCPVALDESWKDKKDYPWDEVKAGIFHMAQSAGHAG